MRADTRSKLLAIVALSLVTPAALPAAESEVAIVSPPPESFFEIVRERDREPAREFYAKYASAGGLPVVAAEEVADEALTRTVEIVEHMLAGRPDVLQKMVENQMYLIIIGKNQVYTDMPENRHVRNKEYMNERVRGTGGKPTSFGEENLLCLALDRYDDESIAVHEFCHTIDGTLRSLDSEWRDRVRSVYRSVLDQGKYQGAYAGSNPGEYWAEIAQSYFDCNRVNNWNHGPVGTREDLRAYDPEGYQLVHTTFNLTPENDWRYTYLQKHPVVIDPPEKFDINPYYTKFSWAREFTVLGRQAPDAALLKANDTIRKLFAYRHDILKALITDDVRLVVLGAGETLSDLPEWPLLEQAGLLPDARQAKYSPDAKLVVVPAEQVAVDPASLDASGNPVIALMMDAAYQITASRPVDPDWENRGRDVQQYELNVERLDERFGKKVSETRSAAVADGKWSGTPAAGSDADYFIAGVLAYFDAGGAALTPTGARQPILDRAALRDYDPGLYELVHETMAYEGRQDWKFQAGQQ
ncbi:hypothetical protein KOR34_07810 [Posidoniimonas corsicana]|uniref:Uncharacterized protein n=1 Tax=Posidoniimonas corsicana TaxID=1938618 RepID=A0A5C5VB81_9BACT|nr:hypothetical protein [Posidoniimonas corsicana]TWT35884.1 hypothetical protein KOR34_07810 [Posidoniimonas corsicana]